MEDEFHILLTSGRTLFTSGWDNEYSLRRVIDEGRTFAASRKPNNDKGYQQMYVRREAVEAIVDVRPGPVRAD